MGRAPDEEPEHGTTKRFGERRRVVSGPRDERAVGASARRWRGNWGSPRVARHARKPMSEDATREELVSDLAHDGAPRGICEREAFVARGRQRAELILHEPKERRCLRVPRLVDANGRTAARGTPPPLRDRPRPSPVLRAYGAPSMRAAGARGVTTVLPAGAFEGIFSRPPNGACC